MPASILYVSVNKSFRPWMTLPQLEPWAERAWAITVGKASTCDRVVAMLKDEPVAAWRLRGAFPSPDETYATSDGSTRPRTCLALGDPVPVLPVYRERRPGLRHGVATVSVPEIETFGPDQNHQAVAAKDDGH